MPERGFEKSLPRIAGPASTLQSYRIPDFEQHQVFACVEKGAFGGGVVDFDVAEGVEMVAQHFVAFEEFGGGDGIFDVHGEVVADGQDGEVELGAHGDEFHVERQRGVAGDVDVFVFAFDDEAAGIAAVGAIGKATGVLRDDVFHSSERKCPVTTVVHWMGGESFIAIVRGDFGVRYDGRAGAFGDALDISHVIAVGVREQDEIGLQLLNADVGRLGIIGNKRVDDDVVTTDFDGKGGVAEEGNLHEVLSFEC